ncbi:MAG TPA: hypothetical protein DC049_03955, partial [Spirochaetia bacterium]|nr:hypothetical protein [Spirochaetia bacterium]
LIIPPGIRHQLVPAGIPSACYFIHFAPASPNNPKNFTLEPDTISIEIPFIIPSYRGNIVFLFKELADYKKNQMNHSAAALLHIKKTIMDILDKILNAFIELRHSHKTFFPKSVEYINAHFNEKISIAVLAEMEGITLSYYSTAFKKHSGISPEKYIRIKRMSHAIQLMQDCSLRIKDICVKCGFYDQYHFSRLFKRHTGVSPGIYRKNMIR